MHNNNIVEVSDDNRLNKEDFSCIVDQINRNIKASSFLEGNNSVSIKLRFNVNSNSISEDRKWSDNIFWELEENSHVSYEELRIFLIKCLNLKFDEKIHNVLIIFRNKDNKMNEFKGINSEHNTENDDEADEKVASFVAVDPKYKLDQVIMSDEEKRQIDRAIALINNRKKIFEEWGFSEIEPNTKAILCFHGKPGTGKTMCAHALADALNKKIVMATYASIESKYVGEGPKNMRKIFEDAEAQDAILFFDEADSFLSKRINNTQEGADKHYNRMSNEIFQLLESYNGIVVFATNMVTDFDKAFKSRILAFVEFKMPDSEARKKLIEKMIPSRLPMESKLSESDMEELSTVSDGFSGREIRKAMLTTLSEGALNNVVSFTKDEFVKGFNAIKEEKESIETWDNSDEVGGNYIEEFMKNDSVNRSIENICLKCLNQFDDVSDLAKQHMIRICKILGQDIPDFTLSYKDKNITEDIKEVESADRLKECAMYCCELFAYQTAGCDVVDNNSIDILFSEMNISDGDIEKYHYYINSIKQIV